MHVSVLNNQNLYLDTMRFTILLAFPYAIQSRRSHSIKIDTGKSFDKSISIDKLILNDIDFIGQSIKFDTHTPTKC